MVNYKFLFGFFLIVFLFDISGKLEAQEASVSSRQIDEIIVTSRKTEENIQDVPIAVYAVDEKALDDLDMKALQEAQSNHDAMKALKIAQKSLYKFL